MQAHESGMNVLSERVAALEGLIPQVQQQLDDKMEKHFKTVMDSLRQLTGSLLPDHIGSCNPSAEKPRSQMNTSPKKGVVCLSESTSEKTRLSAGVDPLEGDDDFDEQFPKGTAELRVKGMMSISMYDILAFLHCRFH